MYLMCIRIKSEKKGIKDYFLTPLASAGKWLVLGVNRCHIDRANKNAENMHEAL